MAKLTITIEDTDDDKIRVEVEGHETIDYEGEPTIAEHMVNELVEALSSVTVKRVH